MTLQQEQWMLQIALEQEKWVLGYYEQASSRLASEPEVDTGLGALGCSTGVVGAVLVQLTLAWEEWVMV
jgi:hypothetical protein